MTQARCIIMLCCTMFLICMESTAGSTSDGILENSSHRWHTSASNLTPDPNVSHTGRPSLRVTNAEASLSCLTSEPIELQIGQLYRLSAWVKTENVRTEQHEQYPTPVGACVSMGSLPFTEQSAVAGGSADWKKLDLLFIATQREDNISLHLGKNGKASGTAWFDDIKVEVEHDITKYIPMETVKWYGDAFRFEDRGWIFVHIEGAPYKRGYQYGYLLTDEIKEFITKLAINKNSLNPQGGWNEIRFAADALMLRKFDTEYLEEMKGIADGANKGGATVFGKPLTLLDVVALNCAVDVSYAGDALPVTPTPLTGRSFLSAEDDLTVQERLHKCSSFLASKTATKDHRIVFGQLFMWNGFTGVNWNVIVDDQPASGHRLVYETFPGGIHSGADFYINDAGIMIGETTVMQSPFDADGTPQSYRIRKAAQYGESIDDVVRILTEHNNGLYTNDWLIGDAKTDEIAVLALGTKKYTVWRSSKAQWYDGQTDWYWSDNNVKSDDVRREYVTNEDNAPYDVIFKPVNRDIAFRNFYRAQHGSIDANAGIDLLASSPINRPHACDGKVTTGAMADRMMFFAHSGKVTLREKFVGENGRIPDLPGAQPQFTLGYSVISPFLFVDKLKEAKRTHAAEAEVHERKETVDSVTHVYEFDQKLLWRNSVYPASSKENWYVSGTAAYWNLLHAMPATPGKAVSYVRDELAELNCRYLYTTKREGTLAGRDGRVSYDHYKFYQVPRIRGTVALHQLRLLLGNELFAKAIGSLHDQYAGTEITNTQIVEALEKAAGRSLKAFLDQWLDREDLPACRVAANVIVSTPTAQAAERSSAEGSASGTVGSLPHAPLDTMGYTLKVVITQNARPYHFFATVMIETATEKIYRLVEIQTESTELRFAVREKPLSFVFNSGNDVPMERERYFTFSNFTDDFAGVVIVYGTTRQVEANHTLALRFQKMAADRFTETLLPLHKDAEIDDSALAAHDLVVIGNVEENSLTKRLAEKLHIDAGKNTFRWMDHAYGASDDGLFIAAPNPFNPSKAVYLVIGNSALEVFQMTKTLPRIPQWAVFKKDQITEKGYFPLEQTALK
jgi:hypothetical protein